MLTVDADLPLGEALAQLTAAGVSTLVVQVAGQAAGILTEHDWLRLLREQSPLNCPVGELMSTPLVAVSPEMEVDAAESLMQTRGIRHLALIDEDGRLQGVVSAATTWLAQRQSLRIILSIPSAAPSPYRFPPLGTRFESRKRSMVPEFEVRLF